VCVSVCACLFVLLVWNDALLEESSAYFWSRTESIMACYITPAIVASNVVLFCSCAKTTTLAWRLLLILLHGSQYIKRKAETSRPGCTFRVLSIHYNLHPSFHQLVRPETQPDKQVEGVLILFLLFVLHCLVYPLVQKTKQGTLFI